MYKNASASLAQLVRAFWTVNRKATGSIPVGSVLCCHFWQ